MTDISKLPKWAQSKIARLEEGLAAAVSNLAAIHAPADKTVPICAVDYGAEQGLRALPYHTIRFHIAGGWVDIRHVPPETHYGRVGALQIMTYSVGDLLLTPRASNVVLLDFADRAEMLKGKL